MVTSAIFLRKVLVLFHCLTIFVLERELNMLEKFAVTNFRGFRERIEWDLTHPGNYSFNTFAVKDGVVKNCLVYGPNGSGKTNFSLAVFDIVNHLTQKNKLAEYYLNFLTVGSGVEVATFEYYFRFESVHLEYIYSKDKNGEIVSEQLTENDTKLFSRSSDELELNTALFRVNKATREDLSNNANRVSIVNYLWSAFPLGMDSALVRLKSFVESMLWFRCLDDRKYLGLETGTTFLHQFIIMNGLVSDFERFLLDVSGQEYHFAKPRLTDSVLLCKIGNSTVPFNTIQSTGTRALELLYYWLQKIKNASLVIVDEFDAFYHFQLAYRVCERLFDLNCQVFMTTHNTSLMTNDLLRPDCYFLIDGKKIKAICDCTEKELRLGHNLEKLYRGDAFQL